MIPTKLLRLFSAKVRNQKSRSLLTLKKVCLGQQMLKVNPYLELNHQTFKLAFILPLCHKLLHRVVYLADKAIKMHFNLVSLPYQLAYSELLFSLTMILYSKLMKKISSSALKLLKNSSRQINQIKLILHSVNTKVKEKWCSSLFAKLARTWQMIQFSVRMKIVDTCFAVHVFVLRLRSKNIAKVVKRKLTQKRSWIKFWSTSWMRFLSTVTHAVNLLSTSSIATISLIAK